MNTAGILGIASNLERGRCVRPAQCRVAVVQARIMLPPILAFEQPAPVLIPVVVAPLLQRAAFPTIEKRLAAPILMATELALLSVATTLPDRDSATALLDAGVPIHRVAERLGDDRAVAELHEAQTLQAGRSIDLRCPRDTHHRIAEKMSLWVQLGPSSRCVRQDVTVSA